MNNIQKNFKAKSALRHCADGGRVSGPGGPVDDKVGPVMLSDKEYVLPADTVDAVGVEQLDALRAMTHTPAGLRRIGNNPERAAMMQKQYDQPVTGSAMPTQTALPLPLPENAPKADTRPEKAFMYRDNLGESLKGLRDKIPGLANGGMLRDDLLTRNTTNAGTGGLRTVPPTVAPTVPGGNTLPAVRGPAGVMATGGGGVPPIKDIPGEVLNRQPRLPAPETPEAAPKPSMLGKVLKYGGGLISGGMALKDINDNGLNLSNGTDLALSAGTMLPNKYAAGASMAGLVGKGIYQALPDDMLSSAPGAGGEKPGFNPRRQYQIGTNDSAPEPKIGGGAYDAMSDRIAKDALSRPAVGVPAGAPAPAPVSAPSLTGTSVAPTPGYQTEALGKLGVPESVQNGPALEQGARTLATAGKGDQFQNLGTYGGDANLYGRASDPSKPGRINDLVGVGAEATPEPALRGGTNTIPGNDAQVQRGRELLAQDAAQRSARGSKLRIGTADGELGSTEQRFGAMRRELQQKFGSAGDKYLLGKHMQKLNEAQSTAMANDAATAQRGEEARLKDATDRYVSDNTRESYKYTADANRDATMGSALRTATKEASAARLAAEKEYAGDMKSMAETFATEERPASAIVNMLARLPQEQQDVMMGMSSPERQEYMASLIESATAGRNMEPGRDAGAALQNTLLPAVAVGGLSGLRTGKPLAALAGAVAGGAGYYFTPKNKPSNLNSPIVLGEDGLPVVQRATMTDVVSNGAWDTLTNDYYRDAAGNLIKRSDLTADQLSGKIATGQKPQSK